LKPSETDNKQRKLSRNSESKAAQNVEPKVLTLLFTPSHALILLPPSKKEAILRIFRQSNTGKRMLAALALESNKTARDGASK
jgi:hypothetical protein